MRIKLLLLIGLSGLMAGGGYLTSELRAREAPPPLEAIAQAGGESFFGSSEPPPPGGDYQISALSIFSTVALHVKDNYVEPDRIDPKQMLLGALGEIEKQVAEVLVEDIGQGEVKIRVPGQEKVVKVGDVENLWEVNIRLRDVFRFFEKHLPPQKDLRAVEYAAANGALSTLDPHSVLLKPEAFSEMKTSTKGEFGGLGIVISIRDSKLTIISPLDGTPASRAGLRAMDTITRIGDVSTVSMPIEDAVRMLRGAEGSRVTIWVERKGWSEGRKFTLVRERIKIESVESQLLEANVGYIKIKNFQQNTGRDLDDHLRKLEKKAGSNLKGLVLDLRNNPGGLLDQAIRVADKFLSSGDIVTTVGYGNKLREPKRAQWSGTDSDLSLVVLVSNGSASASEIVSGALKNLDRALILGARTFGKGSVQVLYDFADSSALKLTIAQYLTPGGVSIQSVGVAPDIELRPAWIEKTGVRLFYEVDEHREKNLEKHLDQAKGAVKAPEDRPPERTITYLMPSGKEPDPEEEPAEQEYNAFTEDFEITLARQVLVIAGKPKRSEMLAASAQFFAERDDEQREKIKKAIDALGVDWSSGPKSKESKITAGLELKSASAGGHIVAGSEVEVVANVLNEGATPLFQVRGHLETDHGSFRGREFLFGRIDPGQSRSWTIKTKVPKEASSRSDVLRLMLVSEGGPLKTDANLAVATDYVAHPQFAYSYEIDDRQRGDGDGILERGEGVDFVVFASNVGPGPADRVYLKLKSAAGEDLFLERGQVEIGPLASGETKVGRLRFRVRENQTPGKDALPLELTIADSGTSEWLEDELKLQAQAKTAAALTKDTSVVQIKEGTRAFARPEVDPTALLGVFEKSEKVRVIGGSGEFLRIELPEDTFAFVERTAITPAKGTAKSKVGTPLTFIAQRRQPVIQIDGQLGGRVVDTPSVSLSGKISGRALKDMYVMLNDEKVFYAAGPKAPNAPADGHDLPVDDAVVLPFQQTLKLKDGLNRVLIVGRLDDRVVSYRHIFVSKIDRAPGSSPMAEAVEEPAQRQKPN